MPVSELPVCGKQHTNPKLAIVRGFDEGLKILPTSESLAKTCKAHTIAQTALCHGGEFGAEEGWMSSVNYCLPLVTGNVGTLPSTTNLSFLAQIFLATGGNVPFYINTGELLLLKT